MPRTPRRLYISFSVVSGSWSHTCFSYAVSECAGVFGTTWKKKSRNRLPEERYVAEFFSIRPLVGIGCGGERTVELNLSPSHQ